MAPPDLDIVRVDESNALAYKQVRLAMLRDAPEAFSASLIQTESLTDDDWRARTHTATSFIAYATGSPAGAATLYPHPGAPAGEALLVAMWVAPDARGTGVGEALVDQVLSESRERGLTGVRLDVMRDNARARGLYERMGFRVTDRPAGLADDACGTETHMALALR